MSRRRSTSNLMGPPPDRDMLMGPPPVPAPVVSAPQHKQKDPQDISEKYRKLKRRFFELEEKHKETSTELQRSGERNVKMREERNVLLDRIIELESQPQLQSNGTSSSSTPPSVPLAQPSSSALPRTLLTARARTSFIANLRQAIAEDDADDDVDPALSSRHVGPQARKREEEERRERQEEEAREAKKGGRRTRGSQQQSTNQKGKEPSSSAAGQPLMTYSPANQQVGPGGQGGSPPVLVSSTGTRLRIKPPAPPAASSPPPDHPPSPGGPPNFPSSSSSSSSRAHSHHSPLPSTQTYPQSYTHPPPAPPPGFQEHMRSPPQPYHGHEQESSSLTPEPSVSDRQDDVRQATPPPDEPMDHVMEIRPPSPRGSTTPPNHHHSQQQASNKRDFERMEQESTGRDTPKMGDQEMITDTPISPAFPLRSEGGGFPASSRSHETAGPPSTAPRRENPRRRGGRSSAIAQAEQSMEVESAPLPKRTTRTTRSGTAAKAAAAAATTPVPNESQPKRRRQTSVTTTPPASVSARSEASPPPPTPQAQSPAPSLPRDPTPVHPPPEQEDVQMEDAVAPPEPTPPREVLQDLAPKEETPAPPSVSSHPTTPAPSHTPSVEPPPSAETVETALTTDTHVPSPPLETKDPAEQPKEQSPIMDSIVKVAEAAIAAQNAAKAASSSTPDPNLDPALAGTNGTAPTVNTNASPAPPGENTTSPGGTTPSTGSVATPTSAAGVSVKTNTSPSPSTPAATIPGTHPMPTMGINPYSMYYPSPGTPVTPNTPTYPHPYNPYYYLAGPMAGPSALYAPSPNFIPPSAQRTPSEVQRQAKPKRLKAHTVTSKSYSIPMVPRDKKGKPMLPLNVGIMTVINLGDVCMREHFHTERYIFPVGYEVTRRYLSTVDAGVEVVYHCTILDGGDGPKFQIIPSDAPDRPVIAGTATGAWSNIVKQANAIRNRQHSNSVSGPDFFGLGQNTIKHLIQELPNADKLRDYVWQNFVEGGPLGGRHAAVIPALPEEYDASMPIGAYYPSEREKLKREAAASPSSPRGLSHYPQHIVAQAESQRAQQLAMQQQQQHAQGAQQAGPSSQSAKGQPQKPAPPQQGITQVQQGVTQIVLPPPTTSETLNIQEYQPPPAPEKRTTRNSAGGAATRTASQSPAPTRTTRQTSRSPSVRGEPHHTRSSSRSQPAQQSHSPYLANSSVSASSTSPPPIPTTFASIMNAYPTPGNGASPKPGQSE